MKTRRKGLLMWALLGVWFVSAFIMNCPVYAQGNITDFHKILRDRIEKLSKGDWNKADYDEIHKKIIAYTPKLKGEEGDFKKHLENTYGKVLIRSSKAIIDGTCSPEHKKLGEMMREVDRVVKLVSDPSDLKSVLTTYKEHQEVLGFISSVRSSRMNGITTTSRYDEGYITTSLNKRKTYQSQKNWTCTSIKDGLEKIPTYLNDRHKDFLTRLVTEYLKEDEFTQTKADHVDNRIKEYFSSQTRKGAYSQYGISKSTAEAFCNQLLKQVAEYNEEKIKEKEEGV